MTCGDCTRSETRAAADAYSQRPLEAECATESEAEREHTVSLLRVDQLDKALEEGCIGFEGVKPSKRRGSVATNADERNVLPPLFILRGGEGESVLSPLEGDGRDCYTLL